MKTSATVHSGLSKKKMASSIQVSRTIGDGLAQNTNFEQYGIFVNLHKEFNHKHTLNLNFNGIIQEHNSNQSDTIGAYNLFTTKYNGSLGMLNNQKVSISTNYERSPLISLTHFWQYRRNTLITSQIFARFNRSAKLYPIYFRK